MPIPSRASQVMSTGRDTVRLRHGQTAATAAALTATLGLGAASWVVAVRQMNGMDMGAQTRLGSPAFFAALWAWMMAAMMLPGAAPAVVRRAHASGVRAVPLFVGSYVAVWALVGVAVYALYQPHGTFATGAVVIAAGAYEFTPVKQRFRRRCRQSARSQRSIPRPIPLPWSKTPLWNKSRPGSGRWNEPISRVFICRAPPMCAAPAPKQTDDCWAD